MTTYEAAEINTKKIETRTIEDIKEPVRMNSSFVRLLTNMMFIAGITSSDIDKVIDDEVQNNAERSNRNESKRHTCNDEKHRKITK